MGSSLSIQNSTFQNDLIIWNVEFCITFYAFAAKIRVIIARRKLLTKLDAKPQCMVFRV